MGDETGVGVGDVASTVILSPAGGLLRTWDESNETTLWSVRLTPLLFSRQGSGLLGRSRREERRFFEAGLLVPNRQTLMLQGRFPTGKPMTARCSWTDRCSAWNQPPPSRWTLRSTTSNPAVTGTTTAFQWRVPGVGEGGWDAPTKPHCLCRSTRRRRQSGNVIETAPSPLHPKCGRRTAFPARRVRLCGRR